MVLWCGWPFVFRSPLEPLLVGVDGNPSASFLAGLCLALYVLERIAAFARTAMSTTRRGPPRDPLGGPRGTPQIYRGRSPGGDCGGVAIEKTVEDCVKEGLESGGEAPNTIATNC